jgi:hypothetical protein
MSKLTSPFIYYTHDGRSVRQGHLMITPRSQAIGVQSPFGALVWNRPVGITIVDKQTNSSHYQPINDITRLVQWSLYGISLLVLVISLKKRNTQEVTR